MGLQLFAMAMATALACAATAVIGTFRYCHWTYRQDAAFIVGVLLAWLVVLAGIWLK